MDTSPQHTRASVLSGVIVIAAIVLGFLLVFIVQNSASATVHFLGMQGSMPLGVAMVFAALAGALLVALVGIARSLQPRSAVRKRTSRQH
ncbi:lipopolysaccharide assembly protein LapA domain-containing protein [Saccharopolyspora elongata]